MLQARGDADDRADAPADGTGNVFWNLTAVTAWM